MSTGGSVLGTNLPSRPSWASDGDLLERADAAPGGFPIVVHSHLRWSFVWQRPQQTHSRLARRHPILFLEEPFWRNDAGPDRLEISSPCRNLWVAQPRLAPGPDPESRVLALLRSGAHRRLRARFARAVHWVYTPLMEAQVDAFDEPAAVVYDCMDELSKFAFAPAGLVERERRLISRADLVFAGGYELAEAKRRHHPRVHAFGCGVEFAHFAEARAADPPEDVAALPRPRLGYIGVIDERLDYDLLSRLANRLPHASVVMIGPIVKVDPASLPRARNIHYLGARDYRILPSCLAGFDACLMPFAMNEASYYINPTKTLEYLASGRPVVSTPVRDVVRRFSDVVRIAAADSFPESVASVLQNPPDPEPGLRVARRASWEETVARMESLIREAVERRGRAAAAEIEPLERELA